MMLKRGVTTGTCAQAAVKGACLMLINNTIEKAVEVQTPSGVKLNLKLIEQKIGDNFAQCAVSKDSGDEPDVTDGAKIYAQVKFTSQKGVTIRGGEGIGRVTKPGLAVRVGEYAINPIPRKMIKNEASRFLPKDKGIEVTISVPGGEKLAEHTFNPRLGIIGGISIIGTTGIIEPKSLDAYKASLALQLNVLKAQKVKKVVLVLGYVGEKFCKERLKLNEESVIKIGDQVGFMLEECLRKKMQEILLIGHLGKMIKITNGQFNTHSKFGDRRIDSIVDYARKYGAREEIITQLLNQTTAEATIEILKRNGFRKIFNRIAQDVVLKLKKLVEHRLKVSCILLSLNGKILGWST